MTVDPRLEYLACAHVSGAERGHLKVERGGRTIWSTGDMKNYVLALSIVDGPLIVAEYVIKCNTPL
ncbi:hypothetical protein SAMN04487914_14723 [Arthrobacter sp. ok909]|uniref:hypothetical protein n=1 Tax=Arthrobacter sp. ok909 TaxID=1761746 RepID=UPI0008922D36|nr:hypothetical protein [Arthrobacter sp. ok909]SDP82383.1 hypothetical protein SAMN04487914_14723 [Arthrobacter sp. ok909]